MEDCAAKSAWHARKVCGGQVSSQLDWPPRSFRLSRAAIQELLRTAFRSRRLGFQYPKPRVLQPQHQPLSRLLK
jgi:hypothetical protein